MTRLIWLFLLLPIVSCFDNQTQGNDNSELPYIQSPLEVYVYECNNELSFTASVEESGLWLFLPSGTINLHAAPSDSGDKFSNDAISFWHNGHTAKLESDSLQNVNCSNNPTKAVWEHAKLSGVDFRAIGNEPNWDLEITAGDEVIFNNDYGNEPISFLTPEPITVQETRTTTYEAIKNNKKITLILKAKETACTDSVSGQSYETTVTVHFDGEIFNGCGQSLH